AVAYARGARLHGQRVRAGVGLGQPQASKHQAVWIRELGKPPPFLFFGAAGSDARDRKRHRLDARCDTRAAPAELFVEDQLGQEVEALAAVLLGDECRGAESELMRFLDHVVGKLLGLVVLSRNGTDFLFSELVGELANLLLLGSQRELERHAPLP